MRTNDLIFPLRHQIIDIFGDFSDKDDLIGGLLMILGVIFVWSIGIG